MYLAVVKILKYLSEYYQRFKKSNQSGISLLPRYQGYQRVKEEFHKCLFDKLLVAVQ